MADVLVQARQRHEFLFVDDPERLPIVAAHAAQLAEKHAGAVIAAGGDGTINAVAQAVLPTARPFGIVPQGTFNYSSRAHKIPLDPLEATRALLDSVIKPVQVGLLNQRVFLVNASLGLYPDLLQDREEYKRHLGRNRLVAMLAGLMTLVHEHRQLALRVEHDDERDSLITPSLFVGNNELQLEEVGVPEAEAVERRKLVAIILRRVTTLGLLKVAIRGALGTLGQSEDVETFAFRKMTVRPARGQPRRRVKVATDGEVLWMTAPLEFSVSAQPLLLMAPNPTPANSGP